MPRQPDPTWGWKRPDDNGWHGEYHVVGTREVQEELRKLKRGDDLGLRREPKRGNKTAITVYAANGVRLGWLEEKDSAFLAPAMDTGLSLQAISAVSPSPDAYLVGLWILIREATPNCLKTPES